MRLRRLAVAVVMSLAVVAGGAHARGQLQTRQTSVDLPPGMRAGRLVLANDGTTSMAAQVRIYAWSQDGRDDQLVPSDLLEATPAIVEIPAGGEQLVRIVRPTNAATDVEQAYRVIVDELPGDPKDQDNSAVSMRMRFVIPAFVRSPNAPPPALQCRLQQAYLQCENRGGRAAQLGKTRIVDVAGHAMEVTPGLLGYVLAGQSRGWALDAAKLAMLGSSSTLHVSLNGEPASVELGGAR